MERGDYAFQEYATLNWIHHLESLESHELDSNQDETSRLRRSLAVLRQHSPEENAGDRPKLGQKDTEADYIYVSDELNAWRSVYDKVEILYRGDGFQK